MSRILPPSSSLTDVAVRPVTETPTILATLAKAPQAVARLPADTLITAIVLGRDEQGGTLLRSQYGNITLNARAQLPAGTQVSLQVGGSGTEARSVTIHVTQAAPGAAAAPPGTPGPSTPPAGQPATGGQPAATEAARSSPTPPQHSPSPTQTAGTAAARPAAVLGDARNFVATVTGEAPPGPKPPLPAPAESLLRPALAASGERPVFARGAELTVRVLTLNPPNPASTAPLPPSPGALQAGAAPVGSPANPAAASPAGTAPAAANLPPGPSTSVPTSPAAAPAAPPLATPTVPVAGAEPATHPATPAMGSKGVLLPATVSNRNPLAQPVLQTPFGELTLAARANLAPGSTLTLEVLSAAAKAAVRTPPPPRATGFDLSREWPTLKEAVAVLQQADPAAAARVVESTLPRAGPQLSNNLLFLIAAMRIGDLRAWLGDQTNRVLTAKAPELAVRLGEEFSMLSKFAADSPSGEWRAYFLPVHDGQTLQQMRVFTRRQKRKQNTAGGEDVATRFIVEVELSRFGPMQFDGLAHEDRFDLIVRSHITLPEETRREIARIFTQFRGDAKWNGELGFQAVPSFPISPLEELNEKHIGVVV